jgi:basic membrane protein A and related proteins
VKRQKLISVLLVFGLIFAFSISLAGAQDDTVRVTLVINGTLGDRSFFDSAQRGMDALMDEFDVDVNTVELSYDRGIWESGLHDVMSDVDSYDVLIVGTFDMMEFLASRVHLYPDKAFILYDVVAPYDDPDICVDGCQNVYSVTYAQNEGSFLVGAYAVAMSLYSELEGIDPSNAIIGAVGGMPIPVIEDFLVGYEQGACFIDPDAQVIVQYAGAWDDPARGKEITLAMYEQGADIVFGVAGQTGIGVLEGAEEQGRYAIGVDSDQALIVAETNPGQAEHILTSMMKNVDNSLYRAITLYFEGEMPLGEAEALGIVDGGVGLAANEYYEEMTPQEIKNLIAALEEAILAGDIVVNTAFGDGAVATGMTCDEMPEFEFDIDAAMAGDM